VRLARTERLFRKERTRALVQIRHSSSGIARRSPSPLTLGVINDGRRTDSVVGDQHVSGSFGDGIRKQMVWIRGHMIPDVDSRVERKDDLGNRIRFNVYGNRSSRYGWEIDYHPTPLRLGGSDHISNLRPLNCRAKIDLLT
jgi:hypothetical protein